MKTAQQQKRAATMDGLLGPELARVLRPQLTMDEMLARPWNPREWLTYIGVDPARAPGGDWCAVVAGGIPRKPTAPWYNVPLWAGQVRGTNLIDVFASLMVGPLRRLRNFRAMGIDDTHDYSFTDMASKRYQRRVVPIKFQSAQKDDMWKIHWMMHKMGRRYPQHTSDPRLNEVWEIARHQMERHQVSFTPTGKIRLHHGKKGHDDVLDADLMQCWLSYQDMRRIAMRGTAHVARVAPGRHTGGTDEVTSSAHMLNLVAAAAHRADMEEWGWQDA